MQSSLCGICPHIREGIIYKLITKVLTLKMMIIKHHYPLISCICITADRPSLLLKAIVYYDYQNYPNKELVISYPQRDLATKTLVKNIRQLSDMDIVVIERDDSISLGMARNEAVAKCNGEYIITWDDDDWYREFRIMYQYQSLRTAPQKREACILTNVILYDKVKDNAFYSGTNDWAGTLLCKKEIVLQYPYLDDNVAEDFALIQYLSPSRYLNYLANYNLYAYIFHGTNTVDYYQYAYFFKDRDLLDQDSKNWPCNLNNISVNLSEFSDTIKYFESARHKTIRQ